MITKLETLQKKLFNYSILLKFSRFFYNRYFKVVLSYFFSFFAFIFILWYLYNRFIRERLPKEIPFNLHEIWFYALLYSCFIYLFLIKNLLFPRELNPIVKKLIDLMFLPLTNLDTRCKTTEFIQPYYMKSMTIIIKILHETNLIVKNLLFILFQIIPRGILVSILLLDTFYFEKLHYFYYFILLGLIPLFHRYLKYCFKVYQDHLIVFGNRDLDYIVIRDDVQDSGGEDNEDAIYHLQQATIQEYFEIIYQNQLDRKNFDLLSNIEYYGLPNHKDNAFIKYMKRNYNKIVTDIFRDMTQEQRLELGKRFKENYPKIFVLKDLILEYKNISEKKLYNYIRAFIFSLYFICWSYIIFKSYANIENFIITEIVLHWLTLYLDDIEPFSGINLIEK